VQEATVTRGRSLSQPHPQTPTAVPTFAYARSHTACLPAAQVYRVKYTLAKIRKAARTLLTLDDKVRISTSPLIRCCPRTHSFAVATGLIRCHGTHSLAITAGLFFTLAQNVRRATILSRASTEGVALHENVRLLQPCRKLSVE
jgi:hypothetical protein